MANRRPWFLREFFVSIVLTFAFSSPGFSQGHEFIDTPPVGCKTICMNKLLGICVSEKEVCNYRTQGWSAYGKSILESAMELMRVRLASPAVRACVVSHSNEYSGWANEFQQKMNAAISIADFDLLATGNRPSIQVKAFRERGRNGKEPRSGVAGISRSFYPNLQGTYSKVHTPLVNLNTGYFEDKYRTNNADGLDIAAGTIAHELLHQMGHLHPDSGDYATDYENGYFVNVVGDCVQFNGTGTRTTLPNISRNLLVYPEGNDHHSPPGLSPHAEGVTYADGSEIPWGDFFPDGPGGMLPKPNDAATSNSKPETSGEKASDVFSAPSGSDGQSCVIPYGQFGTSIQNNTWLFDGFEWTHCENGSFHYHKLNLGRSASDTRASFTYDGNGGGRVIMKRTVNGRIWTEYRNSNPAISNFKELSRDKDFVYMLDADRDLQAAVGAGEWFYAHQSTNGQWVTLGRGQWVAP